MSFKIPFWPLLVGPSILFFIGLTLNATAIAVNHHKMPVLTANCEMSTAGWEAVGDPIHACMTPQTHLKFLCDWYFIPELGTASIGDGFETIFEYCLWPAWFIWIALMVADYNQKQRPWGIR